MTKIPKVTVLLPVYNGEKYLREAIKSVLNQSFQDFELLIINDGSTDSSKDIIENFVDPRIRLINQDNKGLSKTLNIGLNLSSGEYIARMDADDVCLKSRLSEQVSFMDQKQDIGVCGTYAYIIDKDGHNIGRIVHPQRNDEIKAQLLFSCPLVHPSVILRKSFFIKNNLQYSNVKSEDYDLWVRSSTILKFANIDKFLIKYRQGVGISETTNKEMCIANTNEILEKRLLNLGDFTKKELVIHTKMFDNTHIPNNYFLKESISLLKKIRLENKKNKLYEKEALDFVIILKWFYLCARMNKKQLLVSTEFWINSLFLFFRLSFKHKISLFHIANAKLGLINF